MRIDGPLLIVGCGKMGGALLDGWLAQGLAAGRVTIVEPAADSVQRFTRAGAKHLADGKELSAGFRPGVVLLAVKPQYVDAALEPLKRFAQPGDIAVTKDCPRAREIRNLAAIQLNVLMREVAHRGLRGGQTQRAHADLVRVLRARRHASTSSERFAASASIAAASSIPPLNHCSAAPLKMVRPTANPLTMLQRAAGPND